MTVARKADQPVLPSGGAVKPHAAAVRAARSTAASFAARFGRPPLWLGAAPGRVNLIGEHTDYNNGFVLPMAIDRYAIVAAAPAGDEPPAAVAGRRPRLRLHSVALDATTELALADSDGPLAPGEPAWANYVRGVVAGFQARGMTVPSLDVLISSDVPLGGGLSSSAALEVATATLLEAATNTTLDPRDKARLCRQAEHDFAGVPCGLMDQLASTLGDDAGALLIDCQFEVVRLVPFADPEVSVLICNTNIKHALADSAYSRRRAECAEAARQLGVPSLRDATPEMVEAARGIFDPVVRRRARHVVTENARTLEAAKHLEGRDLVKVGALMFESHRSLRDDFEVSCRELDTLVDAAAELTGPSTGQGTRGTGDERSAVFGARMTGGGFGGCTVTLVRTRHVDAVAEILTREYKSRTGGTLTHFISHPARGAHQIPVGSLAAP
jgi:galactokinase